MLRAKVPVFDGDPCQYPSFMRGFHLVINANVTSDKEKLMYLEEYTSGLAQKIVNTYKCLPAAKGYKTALRELEERFGKEETIVRECLWKVINFPKIKDGDAEALELFSLELVSCRNLLRSKMSGSLEIEKEET